MGSIIVALPKMEDAKHISDILRRHGLETTALCTTSSKVLAQTHQLDSGVVICNSRLPDMHYTQMAEYMPEYFEMLLLAPLIELENVPNGIMVLSYPLKAGDLVNTTMMMLEGIRRRIRKKKDMPKKRTREEQKYIDDAKLLLMERNHMTEQEAFRYIQKCSMDSGTNMVETAQMVLMLIDG